MAIELNKNQINILNEDFLKQMENKNSELELGFSNYECECYANFLEILNQALSNKFDFDDLLNMYDFFTDVIFGKIPKLIIFVPDEERYKTIYRVSCEFLKTKNLSDEEREMLAFSIIYASCVRKYDEENEQDTWSFEDFTSLSKIKELYKSYQKKFPDQYTPPRKLSDFSKKNYGLTPENPIEVLFVRNEYIYLSSLTTDDGKDILFERIESKSIQGFEHPIDIFRIYRKKLFSKEYLVDIYMYGYGSYNSSDAPKGFKFLLKE